MGEERVSRLKKTLHSLATRIPKITWQGVEEIFRNISFSGRMCDKHLLYIFDDFITFSLSVYFCMTVILFECCMQIQNLRFKSRWC
jgi:hypothetical protein